MMDARDYLDRRTLILGDVNSGKTRETLRILSRWVAAASPDISAALCPVMRGGMISVKR